MRLLSTPVVATVASVGALASGCGGGGGRRPVISGCGQTTLYRGALPSWLAHSNAPTVVPYAIGAGRSAAAFVFADPLRAGEPRNPYNKILWILRRPGSRLVIHATPLHASTPVVTVTPDDSAGPQSYPSYVNVPRAGCWHLMLRWDGRSDSVDLAYRPIARSAAHRSVVPRRAGGCPLSRPGGPPPPAVALQNFGTPLARPNDPGWLGNGVLYYGPSSWGRVRPAAIPERACC
jgi:hypothetical protein